MQWGLQPRQPPPSGHRWPDILLLEIASSVVCGACVCPTWRDAIVLSTGSSSTNGGGAHFAALPRGGKERVFLRMVRQMAGLRKLLIYSEDYSLHPWLGQAALAAALRERRATLRSLRVNGATRLEIPFRLAPGGGDDRL